MAQGPSSVYSQGSFSTMMGKTGNGVVKALPGRLARIVFGGVANTAGVFTINDSATVAGAATANQIVSLPFGTVIPGFVLTLDWPCKNGITVSVVPTGGGPLTYSVSFV